MLTSAVRSGVAPRSPGALAGLGTHSCTPSRLKGAASWRCGHEQRRQERPLRWRRHALESTPESQADLSSQFAAFVNREGIREPLKDRRPTPLLSPSAAISAQMDALQRGDWPDAGAGLRAAFAFSKPYGCEDIMAGRPHVFNTHARSWGAAENWITFEKFAEEAHAAPFCLLLNCDSWQLASRLVFPSSRLSNRAIQTVQVTTTRTLQPPAASSPSTSTDAFAGGAAAAAATPQSAWPVGGIVSGAPAGGGVAKARDYKFTFCMERIEVGAYKGCWLTVGVRSGDYGNV